MVTQTCNDVHPAHATHSISRGNGVFGFSTADQEDSLERGCHRAL